MKNQLKGNPTQKSKLDYSYLLIDEPKDVANELKQSVLKAAAKKAKGESLATESDRDKFIEKQATKIAKLAKEYPEDQLSYSSICNDLTKVKQYNQIKMAMFELEISGSSSQELEPTYQPADDVIVIAAGDPITVEFYIIGKIVSPDNVRVQPAVNVIQSFKGAVLPEIKLAQMLGNFRIYKLTVSSLVRKYLVMAEFNNFKLKTNEIQFEDKKSQGTLLFDKGFFFNFTNGNIQKLGLLQQILLFSVFEPTQQDALKNRITKISLTDQQNLMISDELTNAISSADSIEYFCQLMLNLIGNWVINGKITQEQVKIYRLLGLTYLNEKFIPFMEQSKKEKRYKLIFDIVDLIIYSTHNKILSNQESIRLLDKLLKDIDTRYRDDSIFLILEKFNVSQCRILMEKFTQNEFLEKYIVSAFTRDEDRLVGEIFTACYFYKTKFVSSPYEAMLAIITGITPNFKLTNLRKSKYINMSVPLLFQILARPNSIKPTDLKPENLLQFIRLYPMLLRLEELGQKMSRHIGEEVIEWVSKKPKALLKEKKYQYVLEILNEIFLNSGISECFYKPGTEIREFVRVVQEILIIKIDDLAFWKKINSTLILQAISKQKQIETLSTLYEKYIKFLKNSSMSRLNILKILNEGLNSKFFQKESNQIQFQKILTPIIGHFYNNVKVTNQNDWSHDFCFNSYINEKIMEAAIGLKKAKSSKLEIEEFLDEQRAKIRSHNGLSNEQKQRLDIIILEETMVLDKESIKSYLKNRQKLYIKILHKIMTKGKGGREREVQESIEAIREDISNQHLNYTELNQIMPVLEKDKERLSRLLTSDTYRKIKDQLEYIQGKSERLSKVEHLLDLFKRKFPIPAQVLERQKFRIRQNLDKLQNYKISQTRTIDTMPEYHDSILYLCRYQFFFKEMQQNIDSLKLVVQKSGQKLNQLQQKLNIVSRRLNSDQVLIQEFKYFGFESISEEEIKEIVTFLLPNDNVGAVKNTVKKILTIVEYSRRLDFYQQLAYALASFISKDKAQIEILQRLTQILQMCSRIGECKPGLKIAVKEYETKFKQMEDVLKKVGLKFFPEQIKQISANLPLQSLYTNIDKIKYLQRGPTSVLISLILINSRLSQLEKLKALQPSMQSIKELFNNSSNHNINLSHQDFQNYATLIKFYDAHIVPNLKQNFSNLIQAIRQTSENINTELEDSLNKRIYSLTNATSQFQECIAIIRNPNHAEKVSITKLVANSRIIINLNSQNHSHTMKVEVAVNSEGGYKEEKLFQLEKYKDEAYIIKNKSSDYEDAHQRAQIKRKVKVYLQMHHYLHEINEKLSELLSSGYMLFENQQIVLNIKNEELGQVQKYLVQITGKHKKWDQNMRIICSYSSKATMIGGSKIKDLYLVLRGQKSRKDIEKFRFIADVDTFNEFLTKKTSIDNDIEAPFNYLELIKQFFKFYKTKTEKKVVPAKDREDHYVELFRFEEDQKDYICCLNQISKQKLKGISQGSILSCKKDTTKQDIQSFVSRAILDPDNQYVLLGYDNLSQRLQNLAIQQIEASVTKTVNRIKLCVTGKDTTHAIYRYLNNKMNVTKKLEGKGMKEESPEYRQVFLKKINNEREAGLVRIYKSAYPGLGKTYEITKQVKKIGHQIIYFPISGRTSSINLFNRLQRKLLEVGQAIYSILIQLYETQKESKEIINDFLRQIIMFRSFEYRKQLCVVDMKSRVYIEVQDENICKNLPFLNYLNNKFKEIVVDIKNFNFDKIQFTLDNIKLSYIMEHLQLYKANLLDTTDLPHPNDYKVTKKNDLALVKQYFVDKFPKDTVLTFYQFKYWVDLFYESCCCFSASHQISRKFFQHDYDQKFIKSYGLEKVRSEFFKILLSNSVEFLSFSIENLQDKNFNNPTNQNKKADKNLSFFIVPNNNYGWFEFIYQETSHIPQAIRSFYISQYVLIPENKGKKADEIEKIIFDDNQLRKLEVSSRESFEAKIQQKLRNISGMNGYNVKNDPGYVLNVDNFIKICLISYKMKVNIPLVIQGEAGVGKTALLRHLTEEVFKYEFIPHTINAGLTEQSLLQKIEDAGQKLQDINVLNQNKNIKKKVCLLFDEFNTLPELGYIKEVMMENRFMGEQKPFFKDLIVFAACNPYRPIKTQPKMMMMEKKEDNEEKKEEVHLAFTVKRPPLALGEIIWNFGALSPSDMDKYVSKMISAVDADLAEYKFTNLVCQIQNKLNSLQFGSTSLRDVERFRQLYSWLKDKIPVVSKIKINSQAISRIYEQKSLRAFVVALNLTYLTRLNTQNKLNQITKLINEQSSKIDFKAMKNILEFEQEDFCNRLKINYEGVFLNSALKENLYCVFVCFMTRLPILIVGSPGCSKSLASRIISDNFKQGQDVHKTDPWIRELPKIIEFFFQGSQSCTTSSVEKKFQEIGIAEERIRKRNEKSKDGDKIIPVFVFDEMGLAERSPDNPLKAIHQPLELSGNSNKKNAAKNRGMRDMAFLGISNHDLDLSKMSRFLVLRRPDLEIKDLSDTAKGISRSIFINTNFNHSNIQSYLDDLSSTYFAFLTKWKHQQGTLSQTHKNFFGLRDFYNLIRTFSDLIKAQNSKNSLQGIDEMCDLAIYRNFNGLANSYNTFRNIFFNAKGKPLPKVEHDLLKQVIGSLGNKGRRYPLLIVPDNISQSIFAKTIAENFYNSTFIHGSPYFADLKKSEYITKNITQIMKIVESDRIMVASSINKTAEGALFDLFNKFFIKRDTNQFYRIALQESGYSTTALVHPNFNASVIINSENLFRQSSAFLNRFEKYQFSLESLTQPKFNSLYNKLNGFLNKIEEICKTSGLGHYKKEHLFLNLTPKTIKSLIYKELHNGNQNLDDRQVLRRCLLTLSKVATKDFELIMQFIVSQLENQDQQFQYLKDGLGVKNKCQEKAGIAIIIATGENIWRTNKPDDKVLALQLFKCEEDLQEQIKDFMRKDLQKENTLFIDFTREHETPGANMNDGRAFFALKQGESRVEINYILYLINKCQRELISQKQSKIEPKQKKIRIIVNYNRLEAQRFTPISFLQSCQIFTRDGSSGSQSKKLFKDVELKDILKDLMKGFKLGLDETEETQGQVKLFQQAKTQIRLNSVFSECCKAALAEVLGNQTEIKDDDKIAALKNPQNIKKYNSIISALTYEFSQARFTLPLKVFMKTLISDNSILNFSLSAKLAILAQFHDKDSLRSDLQPFEDLDNFLTLMVMRRVEYLKKNYRQMKQVEVDVPAGTVFEGKLNKLTYFPYSEIETNLLFSAEIQQKMIDFTKKQNIKNFPEFQQEYNKKLQESFGKPEIFREYKALTRSTNEYWKKMFMTDVMILLCEKAKVSPRYAMNFVSLIEIMLKDYTPLMKVALIVAHFEAWASALKIFNIFAENGIDKRIKPIKDFNLHDFCNNLLQYSQSQLVLNTPGVESLKVNGNLNDKIKRFAQIHHNVFFEIENMANSDLIQINSNKYKEMGLIEEFLTIWQTINSKIPDYNFSDQLRNLEKCRHLFEKIEVIQQFLLIIVAKNQQIEKDVYQYLANKLFPRWFNECDTEAKIMGVFDKFYNLCQKSMTFAHNSTGSISIAMNSLRIDFSKAKLNDIVQKLHSLQNQENRNLTSKLLVKMGTVCEEHKFDDNLSVLMCNIILMNIKRFNILIEDSGKGFTLRDLQINFDKFQSLTTQIMQGRSPILKIFAFAFLKEYLYHFVQIAKPENALCQNIDDRLAQKNDLMTNLRFYCLKVLRRKLNAKQISEQYVKIGTFKWCAMFKEEMKQHQSRSIEVPKLLDTMENPTIEAKIEQFTKFEGRDVKFLDEIIQLGSKTPEGRYVVLNFFMKYLYTMAYNKQYSEAIIGHVKSKQAEYSTKMGKEEYKLLLHYTTSKFDQLYSVQKHETFQQEHFVMLNNINWLFATKMAHSPLHSLFFTNTGLIHPSIQKQISTSFMPCGIENVYISIAKMAEADTRNSNIGVYICSNNCDYIYTHLNCGWPNQSKPCEMCGEVIGSGGGHKISRADKGGRRIMSQKFVDNSSFYIGNFKNNFEQFWQAQRCYIQAQINRMRTKKQITCKPEINGTRTEQKINLLGLDLTAKSDKFTISRVSQTTTSVIMLCLVSNLYAFVSLELIKPEEYMKLFGVAEKEAVLKKLHDNIGEYIRHLRKVVDLNTKFYTWIFGIQACIYKHLMNFPTEFNNYVANLQKQEEKTIQKLKTKEPTLSNAQHKLLYADLIRVLESGITTKQFRQVQAAKDMTLKNQFTRQLFQQEVQKIVSSNLFENKLGFVDVRYQTQGKMQFPFDIVITENKIEPKLYSFSRILKLPSELLKIDDISNKYEIIIREKYPILDYLLRNTESLTILQEYFEIANACNLFFKKSQYKFTRSYACEYKLGDFNKLVCKNEINLAFFLKSWKRIASFLGPVQVGCKVYGRINDGLGTEDGIYNFLLDNRIKENANGKIIAGIYHNYAVLHNEVLANLRTRKNLMPKYKNMNLFAENCKISPQAVKETDCMKLTQREITNKIIESSVASIRYGDNLVYHNFDLCEGYFLTKLKGRCQMISDVEKYTVNNFVAQTFSASTAGTNCNALDDINSIAHSQIPQELLKKIKKDLQNKSQLQIYQLSGQLEQFINKISLDPQHLAHWTDKSIKQYISRNKLSYDLLLGEDMCEELSMSHIVELMVVIEGLYRPWLKKAISPKYRQQLDPKLIPPIKQILTRLSRNNNDQLNPSIQQLKIAVKNYVYRNLLSEFASQQVKIFPIILMKEDLWPYGYDIYTKNSGLMGETVIMELQNRNAVKIMEFIDAFI